MNAGGKTISILAVSGIIFAAGALGVIYTQSKFADTLIEERKAGKSENINSLISLNNASVYTFVSEYSAKPEIEAMVRKGVPKTEPPRIILPLGDYKAYAAVLYDKDFGVIATALNYSEKAGIVDPEKLAFSKELTAADTVKNKISHSFSILDGKPVEVFVSAVYPAVPAAADNKPEGYFLTFKVWDDDLLSAFSGILGTTAGIAIPGKEPAATALNRDNFIVKKDLLDVEGKAVATLELAYPLGEARNFAMKTLWPVGILVISIFVIMILVSYLLFSWIITPMKKMLEAFRNNDMGNIEELKVRQDEFGEMSRLMEKMADSGPKAGGQTNDELKASLGSVKEAINILSEELAGDLNDEQSQFLSVAKRNTEKMEKILNSK